MKSNPSDSELEIMQVLWEKGPLTVRAVNDHLNKARKVGYTTTLKIMQIMTEKEMLTRDTRQRSHVYSPTVLSEEVRSNILEHVIRTAFRGNASSLVIQALGNHTTTPEEMREIKEMIEKLEKQQDGDS
jgi:BlaI family penicillinase repressor